LAAVPEHEEADAPLVHPMPTRIFHPQAADRDVLDLVHEDEIADLVDRLSLDPPATFGWWLNGIRGGLI
jgi:hypothetical protein